MQEASDWPLSARMMEEKKAIAEKHRGKANVKASIAHNNMKEENRSNDWSWDNEKESDMSDWLGMPKEEFKRSVQIDSSGFVSDQDAIEIQERGKKKNDVTVDELEADGPDYGP